MKDTFRRTRTVEITSLFIYYSRMYNAKALISSKTFQLAALQAIAGAIVIFATAYPEAGWLMLAKSVVDIAIRLYTSQPIGRVL